MGNYTLRDFAQTYVEAALEVAQTNPGLNDFYDSVFAKVAKRTGLTQNYILKLHHPFHWVFFLELDHPFEIVDFPRGNGDSKVKIKRSAEISDLISVVLERYGVMLEERMRNIRETKN